MSRLWLRLVSCVSLTAYLLANTGASFALEAWIPSLAKRDNLGVAQSPPRKCTCSEGRERRNAPCESCRECQKRNCPGRSCPSCPNQPCQKDCPCPGGCALCSVAKAPCLTPIDLEFRDTLSLGECVVIESFKYHSLKCGGLDRPPRI